MSAGVAVRPSSIELAFPGRLIAGPGSRSGLGAIVSSIGQRALLVSGGRSLESGGFLEEIREGLAAQGVETRLVSVSGEPWVSDADGAAGMAREWKADCVVGIGGGSVLDLAKAAAAMATVEGSAAEFLEGVGVKKHPGSSLPWIALPTTAGTGSETTNNAVLKGRDDKGKTYKKSLRHQGFLPRAALLDPELQAGLPPSVALPCAFDALSQLMEAATSRKANPVTDAFVFEGLRVLAPAMDKLLAGEAGLDDRLALSLAAAFSGMGITGAGLGLVHGIAGIAGAARDIPHGLACALLLYPAFRESLAWLEKAAASGGEGAAGAREGLARFSRIGAAFGRGESPEACVRTVESWTQRAALRGLSAFGFTLADAEEVGQASSCRDSLARLGPEDATRMLASLL
jgi:alcohol dehydrogenase class IV